MRGETCVCLAREIGRGGFGVEAPLGEFEPRPRRLALSAGERLKRLQKDGYIEGFGARLNPERIGLGLLIFVEVSLHRTTPDVFDRFANAVRRAPQVIECHMVAGGFDYLIKTRVSGMAAYRRFLAEVLLTLPDVRETRTYAVMEEVKAHGALPL